MLVIEIHFFFKYHMLCAAIIIINRMELNTGNEMTERLESFGQNDSIRDSISITHDWN